jgi:cytochrome c-type biogenesis protein CcmH
MRIFFALILLSCSAPSLAQDGMPALANTQLKDPVLETRATELMMQLRCIQCQGQSIHDSDAPIAAAMRHEVRTRIQNGESNTQIRKWLSTRYGDWIDFSPPARGTGLLLWIFPLLIMGFAIWVSRGRIGKGE